MRGTTLAHLLRFCLLQVFDISSGRLVTQLRQGHFESINCCVFNPLQEELYSGGNDCSIMAWSPAPHWRGGVNTLDRDCWSDDDSDLEGEGLGLLW
jgi:DNA excision repair protein ERCC-8